MTKRKTSGASKKKMSAPLHNRKSKSVPLSGPTDPVKRLITKSAELPVRRRQVAKERTKTRDEELPILAHKRVEERPILDDHMRVEELPSILETQMRLFESLVRFTPLGYFMMVQRLVREGAAPHRLSSLSPFAFSTMPIA